MEKRWSDKAWNDYLYWQEQDRKTLKRINKLIKSVERGGDNLEDQELSIGKPERLKYSKAGLLSIRIDDANRLVYKLEPDAFCIISCRGHYQ
ncbi:MAG: Txe/YoeB family addiction module toxin [Eggerthellaceae bacterium]|nr:Txe/YoeB family addiction module toxin [Eggerthellaceae bacterium]